MRKFYFTFGQKYRSDEPHPAGGHPDGWFTVDAEDENHARSKMISECGTKWAFCYPAKPDIKVYPLGELKNL